jgi:hypothetical protein
MGTVEGSIELESKSLDPSQQNLFPLAFLCGQS